jgi:hypothetical protein
VTGRAHGGQGHGPQFDPRTVAKGFVGELLFGATLDADMCGIRLSRHAGSGGASRRLAAPRSPCPSWALDGLHVGRITPQRSVIAEHHVTWATVTLLLW